MVRDRAQVCDLRRSAFRERWRRRPGRSARGSGFRRRPAAPLPHVSTGGAAALARVACLTLSAMRRLDGVRRSDAATSLFRACLVEVASEDGLALAMHRTTTISAQAVPRGWRRHPRLHPVVRGARLSRRARRMCSCLGFTVGPAGLCATPSRGQLRERAREAACRLRRKFLQRRRWAPLSLVSTCFRCFPAHPSSPHASRTTSGRGVHLVARWRP